MFAGLVGAFSQQTVTVTHRAAGSWTDGRYTDGAASTATIKAAVYPATGEQLDRLPEARRSRETIAIFTDSALTPGAAPSGAGADVITYGSDTYEVATVKRWVPGGYETLAQKVGQ